MVYASSVCITNTTLYCLGKLERYINVLKAEIFAGTAEEVELYFFPSFFEEW